jgi:CubicO group peptidase (beta-lactamase class C family)
MLRFILSLLSLLTLQHSFAQVVKTMMIERASKLQLNTSYTPPPGDPLSHHASGYAKVICSAVFITGLEPDFAAEHVGYFTAPYAQRVNLSTPKVDYTEKSVTVVTPSGIVRKAIYTGDQGCVTLPENKVALYFNPTRITKTLPDVNKTPWPMGDMIPNKSIPKGLNMDKINQAVDVAFSSPDAHTAAFVVTYKGQIVGERYADGITKSTPLESWSMGKSLSATIMGILIQRKVYTLDQYAPIPEWQSKGDPRSKIRISDIMHMSSGLYCRAPQDPDYDATLGYPDHLYLYTGGVNSFQYAANLPQQWLPNTVGRYRNSDPVLINYLNRLGIEKLNYNYHGFAQKALFDKIGIRTMVMETDPYGNFLTQGYEFASARDWSRLGNLYLQNGIWNGKRILPVGFTKFVSTVAKPWKEDGRPIYGGLFWINGDGNLPIPKESYMMLGAGGQSVTIIPSHHLVIVRLGHFKGSAKGQETLEAAYKLLLEAVNN